MRVIIRADASVSIGSGHVVRCLTLADCLRSNGADVVFVCATLPGALFDLVRSRGYACSALSPFAAGSSLLDAEETQVAAIQLMSGSADWLVVDHYGLDASWEVMMRCCCHRLMAIDDIANRPHSCDLLLDQNYDDSSRYRELVPTDCRLLLGPTYALLRPEYAKNRRSYEFRKRPLKRVFVFFGGSDPDDLTGMTLRALMTRNLRDLEVDIVVGGNFIHRASLNALARERGLTTILGPQDHLADLMMEADIAVGAGGVTNWERMTVGLPSLVITLAENQEPISEQLHQRGIIRLVGKSNEVSVEDIAIALMDEIQSQAYLDRVAPSMALCDGEGVGRVLHAMREI